MAITYPEIIVAKSLIHTGIKDVSVIKMNNINKSLIKMKHIDVGLINTVYARRSVIGQIKA